MMTLTFPEGYELCFVPIALTWLLNLFLSIQVSMGRKTHKVEYPNLYGVPGFHKDADKFNCIQRAHQNTLESMVHVMLTMLIVAFYHPVTAAICGTIWVIGRFIYGIGYALGNPSYRTPGVIILHMGDMPLMFMILKIAFEVATNKELIGLIF